MLLKLSEMEETVTIPISVLSKLSKSLNFANKMLHNGRQLTQNLWKENPYLKLKIENDKDAATENTVKHWKLRRVL